MDAGKARARINEEEGEVESREEATKIRIKYDVRIMHGGLSQPSRTNVVREFRTAGTDKVIFPQDPNGYVSITCRVLVATDVLSRGLDIEGVTHIINFEMPEKVSDYVHRVGRTARGNDGTGYAYTFFEYDRRRPEIAGELIDLLEKAGSESIPEKLKRIKEGVAYWGPDFFKEDGYQDLQECCW